MQVEVTLNDTKDGVELRFNQKPPAGLSDRLEQYGFNRVNHLPFTWYFRHRHPAYIKYGEALKIALHKGAPFESVHIQPSFEPSQDNIDREKFSYVSILYKKDNDTEYDNYVIFDHYRRVATPIATRFGKYKYKEAFEGVDVYPKNHKRNARVLLKEGKVLTGIAKPESEKSIQYPLSENQKLNILRAFVQFADRHISGFSDIVVTNNKLEMPVLFSGWLRQNYPQLIHQKKEIWELAERFKQKHTGSGAEKKAKDPYTNEHGVYTPELAGDRYTRIEIPIPKTAKYSATVKAVLGQDNLYRSTFVVHKEFGDFHGSSSPLTEDDPTYDSLIEAIGAAGEGIIKRLEYDLDSRDSIVGNEERKRERTGKAIKAVRQFLAEEVSPYTGKPKTTDEKTASGAKEQEGAPGKETDTKPQEPAKKSEREQLIDLGFKDLFTAQQAFTKPYMVIDLQSRWYDTHGYFEQQYEKPAYEQIEKWKNTLDAFKGKRDKTSIEQRKEIVENMRKKTEQVSAISILVENEYITFQQAIIGRVIGYAKTLGHTFKDEEKTGEFSAYISEALFNERMIEPYFKRPIPEITDQLIRDFFDEVATVSDTTKIWTIPLHDYLNQIVTNQDDTDAREYGKVDHHMAVFNAMIAGHTIEQKVLKGYPELQETEKFRVGFDGTDFKNEKPFRQFLESNGINPDFKVGKMIDFPTSNAAYLWEGSGIKMITANNPLLKEGYGSFIGIEGEREKVLKAARHIENITNSGAGLGLEYISFEDYNFDNDEGLGGNNGNHTPDTGKNGITKNLIDNPILDIDAWKITPLEYQQMKAIERTGNPMIFNAGDRRDHEAIVKQAIEDKRPVPKKVLEHYPWLVEKQPKENEPKKAPKPATEKTAPSNQSETTYYSAHGEAAPFSEFLTIYHEREHYTDEQIERWKQQYNISDDNMILWVTPDKRTAHRYNPDAKQKENIREIPEDKLEVVEVKTAEGRLIEESYDGEGYIFLLNKSREHTRIENKYSYLDRVIAHLHLKYANGERPTKTQIEQLAGKSGVPNMGMMWEAAELSWLLWYRQIYNEPLPFEMRLKKMIRFWNDLQPTYAYSDSSKELYKQYSTSCPIAAMIAQYTGMETAKSIFEPSAGNGLLLLGADPGKTHANEIDPTRLASLKFQGFAKITGDNAAQPFDKRMTKAYDVVITNPPFSRWEEGKFDKEYMIRNYFNNLIGLAKYVRLEHVMAGLALHCMKDTGKAAIIIMGHVYFSHDGFIAKYRPFFNWLYRHYLVSDIINMNSYKLYNKQGAVERTMLILVNGRKPTPEGAAPQQHQAPHLYDMVNSFEQLWERIKPHIGYTIDTLIKQLKIELQHDILQ